MGDGMSPSFSAGPTWGDELLDVSLSFYSFSRQSLQSGLGNS